jgi:hypothetical protein
MSVARLTHGDRHLRVRAAGAIAYMADPAALGTIGL